MNSNKVTAIATSIIAVSLLGFIFNSTYNSPENIEKRCYAKYKRRLEKGPSLSEVETKGDPTIWFPRRQEYLYNKCIK